MSTITDDFDRANSATLGTASGGFSWTETNGGNLSISSNTLTGASGGLNLARAEQDLDGADHYAQAFIGQCGDGCGLIVRFDASANNGYLCEVAGSECRIFRMDAGSLTQIGSSGAGVGTNFTAKLEAVGNDITLYIDGGVNTTASDSNYPSNLRTGVYSNLNGVLDNFEGADSTPAGDQAIWELTELTVPAIADLMVAVDDPGGTPSTKKMALSALMALTISNVVVQVKTVGSGTYTPTSTMRKVLAIGVGGGGGGGGGINTDSVGGGGGGGGTVIVLLTAAQIGASKSYVVGAGGSAGSNGTATTIDTAGALLNAGGGSLGSAGATSTTVGTTTAGGAGGTAANGDLNIPGQPGERGIIYDGSNGCGGKGGRSVFGFGGAESGANTAGNGGTAYGGGGSGGHASGSPDRAGSAGADGVLYLIEFLG